MLIFYRCCCFDSFYLLVHLSDDDVLPTVLVLSSYHEIWVILTLCSVCDVFVP